MNVNFLYNEILNFLTGHHRQERPPHLRPELLHPALRERGRAIPQSHIVPRVIEKEGRVSVFKCCKFRIKG